MARANAKQKPAQGKAIAIASPKPPARPKGRPSEYTAARADEICEAIAGSTKGLDRLCKERDGWPNSDTIYQWINRHEDFAGKYARAREAQAHLMAAQIVEIADDSTNDTQTGPDGVEIVNHDNINRSRLRVDARKWAASKLAPKTYGDKMVLAGDADNPLIQRALLAGMTDADLDAMAAIASRMAVKQLS